MFDEFSDFKKAYHKEVNTGDANVAWEKFDTNYPRKKTKRNRNILWFLLIPAIGVLTFLLFPSPNESLSISHTPEDFSTNYDTNSEASLIHNLDQENNPSPDLTSIKNDLLVHEFVTNTALNKALKTAKSNDIYSNKKIEEIHSTSINHASVKTQNRNIAKNSSKETTQEFIKETQQIETFDKRQNQLSLVTNSIPLLQIPTRSLIDNIQLITTKVNTKPSHPHSIGVQLGSGFLTHRYIVQSTSFRFGLNHSFRFHDRWFTRLNADLTRNKLKSKLYSLDLRISSLSAQELTGQLQEINNISNELNLSLSLNYVILNMDHLEWFVGFGATKKMSYGQKIQYKFLTGQSGDEISKTSSMSYVFPTYSVLTTGISKNISNKSSVVFQSSYARVIHSADLHHPKEWNFSIGYQIKL